MSSYKEIAKSSGLVAFVQVAQMLFALFRNKAVSVLLGSASFGLYSIYNTLVELGTSVAIFGLNNSIVREISRSKNDKQQIGRVYYVANRLVAVFSLIVCSAVLVFAKDIGYYMFNESGHESGVRCIAGIVLFMVVAQEGYAVLNGIRSMRHLAVSQIVSSGVGSVGTILAILFWRENAIPAALGIVAVTMAFVTFLYVKKDGVREVKVSRSEFGAISRTLLYIGAGVTVAGLISTIMTFLSKRFLLEHYTLSAVGLYQSSWTVSNLYTGIVLGAMGVDFMPRLSKTIDDKVKAAELINQQIIFGVVVSSIAISGILMFSKELLFILYAHEFEAAANIVRWHIIGVFLRVIAFPFSYTILAKGKALLYAIIQTIFWVGDYLLLMLSSCIWGFDGLGVNYPIAYCAYLLMTFGAAKFICGFSFSKELLTVLAKLTLFIALAWAFTCFDIKIAWCKYGVACVLLSLQAIYVWRYLQNKMGLNIWQFVKNRVTRR